MFDVLDVINHKNIKLLPDIKTCGKAKTTGKIMGGVNAQLGQFPWLVVFVKKSLGNVIKIYLLGF